MDDREFQPEAKIRLCYLLVHEIMFSLRIFVLLGSRGGTKAVDMMNKLVLGDRMEQVNKGHLTCLLRDMNVF